MTIEQSYTVVGMACSHCEKFVTEELQSLDGIESVVVDVAGDSVTVTSSQRLDFPTIAQAVDRAGYELTEQTGLL
ncbi:heavy-metal-associated domain-containing protein [uncultured Agrococcus sp.]|uniref:heavy-metal-associated domain-containing protein n=1 Tax=uncultured Agrococcus sp. TaxID=382258 RepID=UPI0025EA1E63|nr:heavy-metal-associated domain-containing protein [uncultured Agrococcus sp.]